MYDGEKQNANPTVYQASKSKLKTDELDDLETLDALDAFDAALADGGYSPTGVSPTGVTTPGGGDSAPVLSGSGPLANGTGHSQRRDVIDAAEVFDMIRNINDPEHPLTLEQLKVATLDQVEVDDATSSVNVLFTPTIPHCSMATLIGLCIRVKLLRSLPSRFKVDVNIAPGTHSSEFAVNKQLNDKERVAAALENAHLIGVVNKCLASSDE